MILIAIMVTKLMIAIYRMVLAILKLVVMVAWLMTYFGWRNDGGDETDSNRLQDICSINWDVVEQVAAFFSWI